MTTEKGKGIELKEILLGWISDRIGAVPTEMCEELEQEILEWHKGQLNNLEKELTDIIKYHVWCNDILLKEKIEKKIKELRQKDIF